jgi:hypothetical protein
MVERDVWMVERDMELTQEEIVKVLEESEIPQAVSSTKRI